MLQTAQRGLVARNLLTANPAGDGLVVDPRLLVTLRARREPSWLAVLGEPQTEVQLAFHGIDLTEHHTDAAVVCARIEGVFLNRLLLAESVAATMVEWLLRPPPADAAEPTGRTVEVLTPRELAEAGATRRLIVMTDGAEAVVSEVDPGTEAPGPPQPVGPEALAERLGQLLP